MALQFVLGSSGSGKTEYIYERLVREAGAHPRKIGFDGEEKFKGHGVAYCATCDGEFFAGKEVFVIGKVNR